MKNLFKKIILLINILILVWVFASYVDIVSDNLSANPKHYPWNIFVLMVNNVD